jgi:hypothetical protein
MQNQPKGSSMRGTLALLISMVMAGAAFAQEPVGCDKFKWPLDRERALLASATATTPGGAIEQPLTGAVKLPLAPLAEAKLPVAPGRAPKSPDLLAGFVRYAALPKSATYRVTLSEPAWIDVVQNGQEIKSSAFTGVMGCEGIRKSVKFDLNASPFVIEISGTTAHEIAIAVTPD